MTAFHFGFDLNHFGWIHQDVYHSPWWTVQRTCILSLFLLCAGLGQSLAVARGQSWLQFGRRWGQIAACAALVSLGSRWMFPDSWIYFGVLHGMAAMLVICRLTAGWGRGLWFAGAAIVLLWWQAPQLHSLWPPMAVFNLKEWSWLGLALTKPVTQDYVPLLPWMGVMWWGMALGQWIHDKPIPTPALAIANTRVGASLAFLGRCSLTWYMVHQPVLIGGLMLLNWVR